MNLVNSLSIKCKLYTVQEFENKKRLAYLWYALYFSHQYLNSFTFWFQNYHFLCRWTIWRAKSTEGESTFYCETSRDQQRFLTGRQHKIAYAWQTPTYYSADSAKRVWINPNNLQHLSDIVLLGNFFQIIGLLFDINMYAITVFDWLVKRKEDIFWFQS